MREGFPAEEQEPSFEDRIRNALLQPSPEQRDLAIRRNMFVNEYCTEHGINKLTYEQLVEIRALPAWQNPFDTAKS